ncbi:hypothetical protein SH661x_003887 [Planctomicrobium sp. SH661]|uniref:hypothetical protein n=1 Tax=Planctomicrobium sp. SH661 TaxID=3448124 RepID=UPI003F5C6B96
MPNPTPTKFPGLTPARKPQLNEQQLDQLRSQIQSSHASSHAEAYKELGESPWVDRQTFARAWYAIKSHEMPAPAPVAPTPAAELEVDQPAHPQVPSEVPSPGKKDKPAKKPA